MALVDAYAACPCGSGEKFKWCCQKVEAYAERAQRLLKSGQYESALKPLEEGLARHPDNPWLLMRKTLAESFLKRTASARETVERLLKAHPGHFGGTVLATRLVLDDEGPVAGAEEFQRGLTAMAPDRRAELAPMAVYLGIALCRGGCPIAGYKHLDQARRWSGADGDESTAGTIALLRRDAPFSAWEKNAYLLAPAPEGATPQFQGSFQQALGWADEGLWSSAASAFELLAAGSAAGALADRNRGICCLWLGDHAAAVAALRRYIARTGPTVEAVDLEALCQQIGALAASDLAEMVQLTWPLRDRTALLAALEADRAFARGADRPLRERGNGENAEGREKDKDQGEEDFARFFILDRPQVDAQADLSYKDVPMIDGELLVGRDSVVLETFDDGRLDRLSDRIVALGRGSVPPAHPRTRIVDRVPRAELPLQLRWSLPADLDAHKIERIRRDHRSHLIDAVWPETPQPALRGRTPLQAGRARDSETALRAALRLLESSNNDLGDEVDWKALRARLGAPAEAEVRPEDVDLERGRPHMSRWPLVPFAALEDRQLLEFYRAARQWGQRKAALEAARALLERPSVLQKEGPAPEALFRELALDAAVRGDRAAAEALVERGRRQAGPAAAGSTGALIWDMLGLQVRIVLDPPAGWVPSLVGHLERALAEPEAANIVFPRLIEMGLIEVVPDPRSPGRLVLDTAVLDAIVAENGPRIATPASATAAAEAGTGGAIWTPESARGGGTGVWSPGAEAPGGPERKIILPGQ